MVSPTVCYGSTCVAMKTVQKYSKMKYALRANEARLRRMKGDGGRGNKNPFIRKTCMLLRQFL